MTYEMPLTGQVFAGCGSAKERDRWYFLNLNEYPKLPNNRLLEHLYDCGPLTLEELQKKEIGIKDAVLGLIKAETDYGSMEAYEKNGVTKYKLTKEGKGIVEMQKECETRWQAEKEFRRKLELE